MTGRGTARAGDRGERRRRGATTDATSNTMNVLFDVTHPAHAHLFRHAIEELADRGHGVRVTSREKDVTCDLLDAFGVEHTPISTKGDSTPELLYEWTLRGIRTLQVARSFDPDVIVSVLSPVPAGVATVLGTPSVAFHDSEKTHPLAIRATSPFTDVICTPAKYGEDMGPKQVRYEGVHELAYLHPDRFDPDRAALADRGVDVDEPYYVLRFVSWGAHHDVGQAGLSLDAKLRLVRALSDRGTVYVTSEAPLTGEFAQYRAPVEPHLVHDLLAHADGYVGDSQTMATEAAILGVPAVRTNSFAGEDDMSNFLELEEYGLLHSVPDEDEAISRAVELADDPEAGARWQRRRERYLADKIDVTGFVLSTILEAGDRAGEVPADRRPTGSERDAEGVTPGPDRGESTAEGGSG